MSALVGKSESGPRKCACASLLTGQGERGCIQRALKAHARTEVWG